MKKSQKTNNDLISLISNGRIMLNSNHLDIIEVIHLGIDTNSIEQFRCKLAWDIQKISEAIGTNIKMLNKPKILNATLSQNAIEIAYLASICIDYFESEHCFNLWLDTPNLQFSNKPPRSFLKSIKGRELIKKTINSLNYGFTA